MSAPAIRFACQTYSWQMSGERYRGRIDTIAAAAAEGGFAGLEPELFMLGTELSVDNRLAPVLAAHGLDLAGVAYAAEWLADRETDDERAEADAMIALVSAHPGAKLVLVQLPPGRGEGLREQQRRAIACMNAVASRARAAGVGPTVHPNSPPGSLFRSAEDYELLLDGLDEAVGFTPDAGHVAAGGMDPLETVRRYRERVDHIHFKDIHGDGTWAPTGDGLIDFPAIVSFLAQTGYQGWVVFEDESDDARRDPAEAARRNGAYAREVLQPLVDSSR